MYFLVGDYTCKTKQDPLFCHIYSKEQDIQHLVSKLVAGRIIRLTDVTAGFNMHGQCLYANDKVGLIDVIHSPDKLSSDHAKYCRDILTATTPLCVHLSFFSI